MTALHTAISAGMVIATVLLVFAVLATLWAAVSLWRDGVD